MNLFDGGSIGGGFDVNSGAELNIFGGSTGFGLDVFANAEANIFGGEDIQSLNALPGSQLNISGGTFIGNGSSATEAEVNVTGGNIEQFFFGAGSTGNISCLLYTSPSPRDQRGSRMPSSA